ncbi:MAG: hypothetical protein COU29_00780 [Candidatus Magasanikbacteria bacterium CG10_big_fil_rev_8_21_14_0_10_36_32]|uniref:SIMPL domain-containing protein n=1 Tax=Candidatus Magasanikbacteria bacterium CG10_big_fil_rev_8_21_14_0_10_36_32 TaxID=1974646 RepID=A0A2M6W693_9BACT|nr:MAG: hypothetical protein COU29_00780 [Candidatus Magasanikbacteria bacterium CG10_big_fil_rev_8_21_14_0_10_36_32]
MALIKSKNKKESSETKIVNTLDKIHCCMGGHGFFVKKLFMTLLGVLLVYLIFYVGTAISLNIKKSNYVGLADRSEKTVSINGLGKVTGDNNIAVTSIGYSNTDKEVAKAQTSNKQVMDQVVAELKSLKIEDKDLQTNYTIYPEYDYTEKGAVLKGYKVTNTVTIKIRDLSKINVVLSLAGKYGANEVVGLNFTIDDTSNLKDQARNKALVDAKNKAAILAQSLGVRLGGVVSYNEYESGDDNYYKYSAYSGGIGGGEMAPAVVSSGSKDVIMNVNVVYEILPKK